MENYLSSSYKLDIDLSFTPFPVKDLDILIDNKTLNLLKKSRQWNIAITSWIRFIRFNRS